MSSPAARLGQRVPAYRRNFLLCMGAVWVLWGSVYLAIRLVVDEVDPFQAMAQRYVMAGVILVAIAVGRRGWGILRISRAQLGGVLVTGVLLLGIGNGLQALAQVHGLPSGVAALIVATVPAWAVLLRLTVGDRPAPATWLGVGLGFAGLSALVLLGQGTGGAVPLSGAVLCLVASVSWTVGSFVSGRLTLPRDVVLVAGYQQFVAAGTATTLAVAMGEDFSMNYSNRGWVAMAWLVVACSVVAFLAYAWLLGNVPLSLTSTHAYVNPVVAVGLGVVALGEPLGLGVWVGGGAVLAAVVLILGAERRVARAGEPASSSTN